MKFRERLTLGMTRSFASRLVQSSTLRSLIVVPFWALRFFFFAVKERSLPFLRFYPGYHGSTIPSGSFLRSNRDRLFASATAAKDGVDLGQEAQAALLDEFIQYYPTFNPPELPAIGNLYHYSNSMFGFSDAFILYSILRKFKPAGVIEVGSGHSSALMLDVAKEHLPSTSFTFIDPYSETIQQVLAQRPEGTYRLIREQIQDVDPAMVAELNAGDILFIDTSHAVKIASDLSTIFFSLLPALKKGVLVHIHDIAFPWEYSEEMVMSGRTYNEIYFVRTFLQFNDSFEILYFNSQMEFLHKKDIERRMPGYFKSSGHKDGQSLWLRKVR